MKVDFVAFGASFEGVCGGGVGVDGDLMAFL